MDAALPGGGICSGRRIVFQANLLIYSFGFLFITQVAP